MKKSTAIRLGGFVGALCVSGALLGTAVSGTGAYFSDSKAGTINAGTGQVQVTIDNGNLDFSNLLPEAYKTQTVTFTAHTTDKEDVWLVFPGTVPLGTQGDTNGTPTENEAFLGRPRDDHGGGLGRYGHLKVTSSQGASFVSNNLSDRASDDPTGAYCGVDGNGDGGNAAEAATTKDILPYCAPTAPILLASGLTNGQTGTVSIEFGFTKLLTSPQLGPDAKVADFKIVATQSGIRPDDPNVDPNN